SASHEIGKKIFIGAIIAVPVLFIVLNLLISADAYFAQMMNLLPQLLNFRADYLVRFLIICIFGFGGLEHGHCCLSVFFIYQHLLMQLFLVLSS
ncbi:hypothetical protein PZE06_28385, partial [Robertmurraya sp. DFI.2.37]|nr:hypothetical protein [Robertmurraya sp. DFI.2.37]